MNKNNEWIEPIIGGVFGIIAIIAAIVEYNLGNNGALAGCIKDISGTVIVVILLIAFIRSLPKKPKNFDELLNRELENWIKENNNMAFIKEDISKRDIYIKTDVKNFLSFDTKSGENGRFVIIKNDSNEFNMTFSLNVSLFFGHGVISDNKAQKEALLPYGEQFKAYAQSKYKDIANIHYDKNNANLIFSFNNQPSNNEDISKIIEIINTMYQAFLVFSSVKR